jgi:hypothetical protein
MEILEKLFDLFVNRLFSYTDTETTKNQYNAVYAPIVHELYPHLNKYDKDNNELASALKKVEAIIENNIDMAGVHLKYKIDRILNDEDCSKQDVEKRYYYFCDYILDEYNKMRKAQSLTPIPFSVMLNISEKEKRNFNRFEKVVQILNLIFWLGVAAMIFVKRIT